MKKTQTKKSCCLYENLAQSLIEYVLIVGVVSLIFVAMGPYMKRAIQSIVKVTADQLRPQNEAEQQPTPETGYLVESFSASRLISETTIAEEPINQSTGYIFNDITQRSENAVANQGFTERNE